MRRLPARCKPAVTVAVPCALALVSTLTAACGPDSDKAADNAKASTPKLPAEDARPAPPADAAPAVGKPIDELPGFLALVTASRLYGAERDALADKVPMVAPDCDGGDTEVIDALAADVAADHPGDEQVGASLAHGVFALAGGKVIARSSGEIADCGGSQTEPIGAWAGQVVPDPELEIVYVEQSGGRNAGAETLHVFKRKGEAFVEVFAGTVEEYEGDEVTPRKIELRSDGALVGDGKVWTWTPDRFAFVAGAAAPM
jgi:hypothetical protein